MTPVLKIGNARWLQFVEIQAAVGFFARKLKGFQRRKVYIQIDLIKGLLKKEHARGMAFQNSDNGYVIRLDNRLKPLAMLSCLAHEMIHVNQWLTGKMVDINRRNKVKWGSKVYSMPMSYSKHPWEKEAYRNDRKLAQSFVDFYTSGWRKR